MSRPYLWLLMLVVVLPVSGDQGFPMRAEPVAPGVYAVITPVREFPNPDNGGWNSNSAFVVTSDGVLLFDTGSSEGIGRALQETISSVTQQPVRWLVNSHGHGDHWLGNAVFSGAEAIFSSKVVAKDIERNGGDWVSRFNRMTEGATGDSRVVAPTERLEGEREILLGNTRVYFLLSNDSHSPGDVMVWLPEQRVLFAGDVVYSDRMPSAFAANLRHWIATLQRLEALSPDVVVPGHGNLTDRRGLTRLRELLVTYWDAVKAGYESGLADYEMVPSVRAALAPYAEEFPGIEEKLGRDISRVYLQVEAAAFE